MEYKYILEFMGVIVILYGSLMTDASPLVMSVLFFGILTITKDKSTGHFNPIMTLSKYLSGRLGLEELLYNMLAQLLALIVVIISFKNINDISNIA